MQKIILLSLALTASARLIAQLYVVEHFSYPDGALVGAADSPWLHHSGTSGTLRVSGGGAYLRQAVESASTSEDAHVPLIWNGQALNLGPDGDGINDNNCLFAAFTTTFSALPGGKNNGQNIGSYFGAFRGGSSYYGQIGASVMNAAAGSFRLGVASLQWSQYAKWFPRDLTLGTTYRVVSSFNLDTQQTTLWIDPESAASPSVAFTPDATVKLTPVDAFALRQGTTSFPGGVLGWPGDTLVDDLRVGRTFAEVISPVPEPRAWALLFGLGLVIFGLGQRRRRGRDSVRGPA